MSTPPPSPRFHPSSPRSARWPPTNASCSRKRPLRVAPPFRKTFQLAVVSAPNIASTASSSSCRCWADEDTGVASTLPHRAATSRNGWRMGSLLDGGESFPERPRLEGKYHEQDSDHERVDPDQPEHREDAGGRTCKQQPSKQDRRDTDEDQHPLALDHLAQAHACDDLEDA